MMTRLQFFKGMVGAGLALFFPVDYGRANSLEFRGKATCQGGVRGVSGLREDREINTEPALPTLPAAGGVLTDPTFGTSILRVTDATTQPSVDAEIRGAHVVYSIVRAMNANSTRLYALTNPTGSYKRATFFAFDPAAFSVNTTGTLLSSAQAANVQEYWMLWHPTNPDLMYALVNSGYAIYEINVPGNTATLIKSLTGLGHTGGSCEQLSLSEDGDVFAGNFNAADGTGDGWWVWKRSTDTVLKTYLGPANSVNEVQIDKSGRYLAALYKDKTCEMWDLQGTPTLTGTRSQLEITTNYKAWSHYDSGYGVLFSHYWTDVVDRNLGIRNAATPTTITPLLNDLDWRYTDRDDHFSFRQNVGIEACASRFSVVGGGVQYPFDNEIVLISTDGSKRVRRVCHHRSQNTGDYYDAPFANQSSDGRFIVFGSNWGTAGGRHDVFVVRIP